MRQTSVPPIGVPLSSRPRALRFWFIYLAVASMAVACRAGAPELEAVLKTFRVDGPKGWSFTQATVGDGHSRVERFNAAQPEFSRWTLLQEDGRAPTEAEVKDYNEKQTRRSRGGSAPPLTDMLDLSTAERVEHNADRSIYRCRLKPGEKGDSTGQHLVVRITLHHPTNSVESFTLEAVEAFSPAFGVKIAEMRTTVAYTLPSGERPSLLEKITTHLRGRAFLVKSLDADLVVTFSDYEKAHR